MINLADFFSCGLGFDFANGPHKVGSLRRILPQCLSSLAYVLIGLNLGLMWTISSIMVPSLLGKSDKLNPDEFLHMTPDEVSWLAGILYIVQPIGNIASGSLADSLGRKNSMALISVIPVIAWFLLPNAQSPTMIYMGFSMLGIFNGLSSPLSVYISEICEPSIRGVLSAFSGFASAAGVFLIFFSGSILSWRQVAYLCAIVPIVNILVAILVPESPIWLLSKHRVKNAEKSLQVLRGWVSTENVTPELNQLRHISEMSATCTNCEKSGMKCTHPPPSLLDKLADMSRRRNWKPFLLMTIIFFFMQFSGWLAMRPYIVPILNAHGIAIDANQTTVILGAIGILANIYNVFFIRLFGKRNIYLYSMAGHVIGCAGLSLYGWTFFPSNWLSAEITDASSEWIREHVGIYNYFALAMFVLMQFCFSAGVGSIPYILVSEVFPFKSRTFCCALVGIENKIFAFIATKIYYDLERWFSVPGVICCYGAISVVGLVLTYLMLPETEHRTLKDIEVFFSDNSRSIFDRKIHKQDTGTTTKSENKPEKC